MRVGLTIIKLLFSFHMAFLRLKTSHGHVMGDAYSAFQKYVRRGDFENALYWGAQIGRSCDAYKGYPNALKKRLLQHSLEDVGHIEYALRLLNTKINDFPSLIPWIYLLCSLPKTRVAAWVNRVAVEYVEDPTKVPNKIIADITEVLVLHRDENVKQLELIYGKQLIKLYREINKDVLVFHTYILTKNNIIQHPVLPTTLPIVSVLPDIDTPRSIEDWVYDKHTIRGKLMGRGYEHFLATMVVNPRLFDIDPYEVEAKTLYLNGKEQRVRHILKKTINKSKKELTVCVPTTLPSTTLVSTNTDFKILGLDSELFSGFTCFLQAQPITGRWKPRVWFATDPDGKQVVIKGPVSAEERHMCIQSQQVKDRLSLPSTKMRIIGNYLIQDSLFDYTKFKTHIVTTSLETNIEVPVSTELNAWDHSYLSNKELSYNILEALLFRKIIGANDTCTRNFVIIENTVYSIDDAALRKPTPYMWKTKLIKQKKKYENALNLSWERIKQTIEHWKELLVGDTYAIQMLDYYSDKDSWTWS